ncbi:MAG: metallophosphoesterase [Promethearchaeota archaeon]
MSRIKISRDSDCFRVFPGGNEIRLLQVTDLHLSNFIPLDRFCLKSIRAIGRLFSVDIIVITGDIFGYRQVPAMRRALRMIDWVIGREFWWTFAWGNHDQELRDADVDPREQLDAIESYLEGLPGCLYRQSRRFIEGYRGLSVEDDPLEREAWLPLLSDGILLTRWDGFYGGNFQIKVMDVDGDSDAWSIFILNSRRAFHVPQKALNWLGDRASSDGRRVPVICFYHVPNRAFSEVWDRGLARGIKRERVCFEREDGRVHKFFRDLGVVRACFAGHDHVNDYSGILDGIEYVYGRKTCLGGYGSYKKVPAKVLRSGKKAIRVGAKLITLGVNASNPLDNTLHHITVFRDGSVFDPQDIDS